MYIPIYRKQSIWAIIFVGVLIVGFTRWYVLDLADEAFTRALTQYQLDPSL